MNTFMGVKDKVVVWGSDVCMGCSIVYERILLSGFDVKKADFNDVKDEPPQLRAELMAAYQITGEYPVVQVNNRGFTVEEAYKMLNIS